MGKSNIYAIFIRLGRAHNSYFHNCIIHQVQNTKRSVDQSSSSTCNKEEKYVMRTTEMTRSDEVKHLLNLMLKVL